MQIPKDKRINGGKEGLGGTEGGGGGGEGDIIGMKKISSFPLLRLRFLLQKSSFIRDEEETKIEKNRNRKMTRYC